MQSCVKMQNKQLPSLDARLMAVYNYVPDGCAAADIGCDHGKLSAALSQKCKTVIAVDSRSAPLAVAKAQIEKCAISNVQCRLGDGLLALSENEADCIIVAGLSAHTICNILSEAPWIKTKACRLIAVPATKPHVLRLWLYENGFNIIGQQAVCAAGRHYAVICAQYSGECKTVSFLKSLIGNGENLTKGYLTQEAAKLEKSAMRQELAFYHHAAQQLLKEAEKCQQ